MTFIGWKLPSGEVMRRFEAGHDDMGKPIYIYPGEHEANKLKQALGIKGKLTPQYQR